MNGFPKKAVLFLTGAVGVSSCGPAIPSQPTWEHDIRPLMVARCIRCHDGAGHVDPATSSDVQKLPISAFNFNYATYEQGKDTAGFAILKQVGPTSVRGPTSAMIPIMPPPPAEKLEDWEIQLLSNWAANPR